MDDEPHVGLVDAHAKGVGGHHHLDPVVEEIILIPAAGVGVQLGVVGRRPDAPALQQAGSLIHLFCGAAIDDTGVIALLQHQFQQAAGLFAGQGPLGGKVKVGPVEAGSHLIGIAQGKMGTDVIPHMSGGGGRECAHHRPGGQAVHEGLDAQVAGAEVLPPLADAVGLVHRDHADLLLLHKALEAWHFQPLRGHIDDLIPALAGAVQHQGFLVVGETVVQKSRCHTGLHKSSHLILHQAHQRRHHQRDARQQQGGHLIADGLTGTGGHHGQHVLPGQQALHDLLLPGAEAVVAKKFFQDAVRGFHGFLRYNQ